MCIRDRYWRSGYGSACRQWGRSSSSLVASSHQLAFVTPGISPAWTITRRQIRHRPNLRYTDLGRPHRRHRVYPRTLNLGVRCCFSIKAFFAMGLLDLLSEREAECGQQGPALFVGTCGGGDGDVHASGGCLLYTSDAADEEDSVDLGGRRII